MKNCAIVCEYNPFHTGHKYQLDRVRALGADNIVCVMSGSFVQSAEPAFCDKALRAKCAVLGGADAVAELPTVYSTASAQLFAEGAIKTVRGFAGLTHIAMGASAAESDIMRYAEIKLRHADRFKNELKKRMKDGKSYGAASVDALASIYRSLYPDENATDITVDPNNILCIEYICAVDKLAARIEPVIIERKGNAYTDTDRRGEYISATAIRDAEQSGNLSDVKSYIPFLYDDIACFRDRSAPSLALYDSVLTLAARFSDIETMRSLRDCSEGLEYSVKKLSSLHNFDRIADTLSGRRYGKKRVRRLFLDAALGITADLAENRFCTRLLACSERFDLSLLPSNILATNAEIKRAAENDGQVNAVLNVDNKATILYNSLCGTDGDYFNYSLVKA